MKPSPPRPPSPVPPSAPSQGEGGDRHGRSPHPPRLVLASASPRRRELLRRLGLELEVRPAEIDETPLDGESPEGYVLRLAEEKALRSATAGRGEPIQADPEGREVVLAADTTVVLDGALLGKPEDRADARRMLERLSGRDHEVLTGVAVCDLHRGFRRTAVESTRVCFAELEPEEIEWYVGTGEPLDKAGAYAVQGVGALFVDRLEGSYSNVVGLPLPTTYRLLLQAGYPLLALSRRP